jgi:hypothetical protein
MQQVRLLNIVNFMVKYLDKWEVEVVGDYEITRCRVQLGEATVILQIIGPKARKVWKKLVRGSYIYGEGRISHHRGPEGRRLLNINSAHVSIIFPQQVSAITYPEKTEKTWCSFSGAGIFKRFWKPEGSENWYASCNSSVRNPLGNNLFSFSVRIPENKLSWIETGFIQEGHRLFVNGYLVVASAPRSQVPMVYGGIQSITQNATLHLPDLVPFACEDYQPCI